MQDIVYKMASGAAQPKLNMEKFKALKIPIPPLHIQTQIVNDITPLDALRTHLQTVIDTHKHRQKMYLRSMLRLHGGSCGKVGLGEVCTFKNGSNITKKDLVEGNVPVIGGGKSPMGTHNKSNVPAGSLILSKDGAYAGYVSWFDEDVFATGHAIIVETGQNVHKKYLYYALQCLQNELYKLQRGCAQPGIRREELAKFKIPLPPLHLQTQWATYLQTIQTSIDDCTQALANLEQERNDILQSYLMAPPEPSTEIVVFDEEKQVMDDAIATVQEQPQEQQQSPQQTASSFTPTTPDTTATADTTTTAEESTLAPQQEQTQQQTTPFTPTTPEEKKAHAYLTKHNLTHIVDWHTRTIQGVAFGALQGVTDFRKGDGRTFRQKLKAVDAKKLKRVVELVGKCVWWFGLVWFGLNRVGGMGVVIRVCRINICI